MDPLSITAGVASLIALCVKAGLALKELHDGADIANAKAQALGGEVDAFVTVLELMKTTLEDDKIQATFQATGHIGSYWKHMIVCVDDGRRTLEGGSAPSL